MNDDLRSLTCQHPRDDLYRHTLTMPNGMFPVVCTRCWGQSMSPDASLPVWTDAMRERHWADILRSGGMLI